MPPWPHVCYGMIYPNSDHELTFIMSLMTKVGTCTNQFAPTARCYDVTLRVILRRDSLHLARGSLFHNIKGFFVWCFWFILVCQAQHSARKMDVLSSLFLGIFASIRSSTFE
jgi:hypothetical protein